MKQLFLAFNAVSGSSSTKESQTDTLEKILNPFTLERKKLPQMEFFAVSFVKTESDIAMHYLSHIY